MSSQLRSQEKLVSHRGARRLGAPSPQLLERNFFDFYSESSHALANSKV